MKIKTSVVSVSKYSAIGIQTIVENVLVVIQVFGLMPVRGIFRNNNNCYDLIFSWMSYRTAYSMLHLVAGLFFIGFHILNCCLNECSGIINAGIAYIAWTYSMHVATVICFLNLARNWPNLMKQWNSLGYEWAIGLKRKVNIIFLFCLLINLAEYTSSQYTIYQLALNRYQEVNKQNTNETINTEILRHYLRYRFQFIYSFIGFSIPFGIFIWIIETGVTFSFTILNSFIVILGWLFAARIDKFIERTEYAVKSKVNSEVIWGELRNEYNQLYNVCKLINKNISPLILLAFAGNIVLVVLELYRKIYLSNDAGNSGASYLLLGLSLIKTLSLCVFGSMVYEKGRKPLGILYNVSDDAYNNEVRIFIAQIFTNELALSAYNMFSIRRSIALQVIGAIVTYELIFIQFMA